MNQWLEFPLEIQIFLGFESYKKKNSEYRVTLRAERNSTFTLSGCDCSSTAFDTVYTQHFSLQSNLSLIDMLHDWIRVSCFGGLAEQSDWSSYIRCSRYRKLSSEELTLSLHVHVYKMYSVVLTVLMAAHWILLCVWIKVNKNMLKTYLKQ